MAKAKGNAEAGNKAPPSGVSLKVLKNGDVAYRVVSGGATLTCRYSPTLIRENIGRLIDDKFGAAVSGKTSEPGAEEPRADFIAPGLKFVVQAKHGRITPIEKGRYTDEEIEREKARYAEESYRHFSENFGRELSEVMEVFLLKVTTATVAELFREGILGLKENSRAGLIDDVFEELKKKFKRDWEATKRGNPNFVLEWTDDRIIEFGKTYNRLLKQLKAARKIYRKKEAYAPEKWTVVAKREFPDLPRKAILQLAGDSSSNKPSQIARGIVAERFKLDLFGDYHDQLLTRANKLIRPKG